MRDLKELEYIYKTREVIAWRAGGKGQCSGPAVIVNWTRCTVTFAAGR